LNKNGEDRAKYGTSLLEEAVAMENYEKASYIRDLIKKSK